MLSAEKIKLLQELTKETNPDASIEKIVQDYIDTKIAYWRMVDKFYSEKMGMSFEVYEDTKREEWDGSDWNKIEEFHDWEDAFIGIKYYLELKDKWIFQTSN
ncbi:MAG TPA: hypothetical protein PK079_10215 [Leptospiraceae bacterium]|nr:hypothetical protein [Leptospiraceae bacterium]HMW06645.1 hypothetical protein [Leptospiraceae bacterium]HMX35526.1 hypothetical protein [Leptospiraceae bacterium]HMY33696.1 hypothetical protein [Leptospiraceae bacterium]HMZ64900.1 hypothetical protein [Leptospiraceae bacterium]